MPAMKFHMVATNQYRIFYSGSLQEQVTSPVQWELTVKTLLSKGLGKSYELGPGKVLHPSTLSNPLTCVLVLVAFENIDHFTFTSIFDDYTFAGYSRNHEEDE